MNTGKKRGRPSKKQVAEYQISVPSKINFDIVKLNNLDIDSRMMDTMESGYSNFCRISKSCWGNRILLNCKNSISRFRCRPSIHCINTSCIYCYGSTSITLVNPHVTVDDAVAEALQTIRSRGHAIDRGCVAARGISNGVDF